MNCLVYRFAFSYQGQRTSLRNGVMPLLCLLVISISLLRCGILMYKLYLYIISILVYCSACYNNEVQMSFLLIHRVQYTSSCHHLRWVTYKLLIGWKSLVFSSPMPTPGILICCPNVNEDPLFYTWGACLKFDLVLTCSWMSCYMTEESYLGREVLILLKF